LRRAEIAPYGTVEVRCRAALAALPRKSRDLYKKERLNQVGVIEVYGIIYAKEGGKPAIFDRQYTVLGHISLEQAEDLIARSVVTSAWEGHCISGIQGYTIWLAHPKSSDARDWDTLDNALFESRPRP